MKTLFLIRHAKSSRDDPGLADKERPLNDRGRRDAPMMGKRLAKRGVKPDMILSSPAVRALTTAEMIAGELDYKRTNIVVDDRLYAVEADDLLDGDSRAWRHAGMRHADWPQPRVDRTRASLLEQDHQPADVRRRGVHVRREIVVEDRQRTSPRRSRSTIQSRNRAARSCAVCSTRSIPVQHAAAVPSRQVKRWHRRGRHQTVRCNGGGVRRGEDVDDSRDGQIHRDEDGEQDQGCLDRRSYVAGSEVTTCRFGCNECLLAFEIARVPRAIAGVRRKEVVIENSTPMGVDPWNDRIAGRLPVRAGAGMRRHASRGPALSGRVRHGRTDCAKCEPRLTVAC